MKRSPLQRKTPLNRGTSQLKRSWIKKKSNRNAIPQESRDAVSLRSNGECETAKPFMSPGQEIKLGRYMWNWCEGSAIALHHIERRRTGNHTPDNLLHVCKACHLHIHLNPAWAYDNGYMKRIGKLNV